MFAVRISLFSLLNKQVILIIPANHCFLNKKLFQLAVLFRNFSCYTVVSQQFQTSLNWTQIWVYSGTIASGSKVSSRKFTRCYKVVINNKQITLPLTLNIILFIMQINKTHMTMLLGAQ